MEGQSTAPQNVASNGRQEMTFIELASLRRQEIKVIAAFVLQMKGHSDFSPTATTDGDRGEMIANVILAYRHLEDAAMRLGKAIQAKDGGVSVYDR